MLFMGDLRELNKDKMEIAVNNITIEFLASNLSNFLEDYHVLQTVLGREMEELGEEKIKDIMDEAIKEYSDVWADVELKKLKAVILDNYDDRKFAFFMDLIK